MLRELIHHAHVPFSIVLDIGSGSVGVGVIETDATHNKAFIIYTHRERIRTPKVHSAEEYVRSLKEALLAATLELSTHGMKALHAHAQGAAISSIRVLYAAPWADIVTRTLTLEKAEPIRATRDLVDHLVAEALEQARAPQHEEALFERSGLEVVYEELVGARLNGYPVHDFHGQECTTIDVVHLSELVPHAVRVALAEAGKNLLPHPTIVERSFARVAAGVVRRVFPHTDSFISIEMTGGGTELVVVSDGVVLESVSTPTGAHAFEQEISERLGTIPEEARAHIRDYAAHTTHEDVTAAITEAREAYKTVIGKLLADVATRHVLPSHLITLADPDYRDVFLSIAEEAFSQTVPEHTVRTLDLQLLSPLVEHASGVVPDQYIALSALFFHTEEQNRAHAGME